MVQTDLHFYLLVIAGATQFWEHGYRGAFNFRARQKKSEGDFCEFLKLRGGEKRFLFNR